MTAVVDTSAIVAIVRGEPDAAELAHAVRRQPCLIAAGTLVEIHAVLGRSVSYDHIQMALALLRITIAEADEEEARIASRAYHLYGRGSGHPARWNVGDVLSYAAAKVRDLPLIFTGDDFTHTDIRSLAEP